jgi:hypothetical protein
MGRVEYRGYNGKIEVDAGRLTITHTGLAAKVGGLVVDQPRSIPLQAVSGVRLREASRLRNGWINLGLGGAAAIDVGSQGASNPNTLLFRHKDNHAFKALHDWLVTVAERNRSTGVDSSAVQFDAAGETRSQPFHERGPDAVPAAAARLTGAAAPRFKGATFVGAWAGTATSRPVVGESFHADAFKAIKSAARTRGIMSDGFGGIEITEAEAILATDPDNAYDPNAIAVWIDGQYLVGHLQREVATEYAAPLAGIESERKFLRVPARVWIADDARSGPIASVSVQLPSPGGITPFNDFPDAPYAVIPEGAPLKVTMLDAHPQHLFESYSLGRGERHVAVVLMVSGETVEVALDGVAIGHMSSSGSQKLLGLVEFVTARGLDPVAHAVLKGSTLGAAMSLYAARTTDVSQSWLNSISA